MHQHPVDRVPELRHARRDVHAVAADVADDETDAAVREREHVPPVAPDLTAHRGGHVAGGDLVARDGVLAVGEEGPLHQRGDLALLGEALRLLQRHRGPLGDLLRGEDGAGLEGPAPLGARQGQDAEDVAADLDRDHETLGELHGPNGLLVLGVVLDGFDPSDRHVGHGDRATPAEAVGDRRVAAGDDVEVAGEDLRQLWVGGVCGDDPVQLALDGQPDARHVGQLGDHDVGQLAHHLLGVELGHEPGRRGGHDLQAAGGRLGVEQGTPLGLEQGFALVLQPPPLGDVEEEADPFVLRPFEEGGAHEDGHPGAVLADVLLLVGLVVAVDRQLLELLGVERVGTRAA